MKAHPTTEVTLDYHALWADEENARISGQNVNLSQTGDFRGHLFAGWVKTKLDKHVAGHLVAEYFDPGDYYADGTPLKKKAYRQDDSFFVRAELISPGDAFKPPRPPGRGAPLPCPNARHAVAASQQTG